jgi:hypothetical protein
MAGQVFQRALALSVHLQGRWLHHLRAGRAGPFELRVDVVHADLQSVGDPACLGRLLLSPDVGHDDGTVVRCSSALGGPPESSDSSSCSYEVDGRPYSDVAVGPSARLWVDPGLVVGPSAIEGSGLFAGSDLEAGRILIRLGGRLVDTDELARLIAASDADPRLPYVDSVSVSAEVHLVLPPGSVAHFGNHSCDPTMWHVGPYSISARRDVASGEELTIDYGTNSAAPGFSMACRCGEALCRGVVTSEDWRLPELQARYEGHWEPALQECIAGSR